jgi:hypothetical protein
MHTRPLCHKTTHPQVFPPSAPCGLKQKSTPNHTDDDTRKDPRDLPFWRSTQGRSQRSFNPARGYRTKRLTSSPARLGTTAPSGLGYPHPISLLREAQSTDRAQWARGPRRLDAPALDRLGEGGAAERASPARLQGRADAK